MQREFYRFAVLLATRRHLIWEMAKRDFTQKYIASWLGLLWTVIHPLILIAIYWFIFGFGLKSRPVSDVPFVVWLTAGLAPWFCMLEIITESTSIITSNPHLVKKMMFPSHILPFVKIISSFFNHLIFLALLAILLACNDVSIPASAFQIVYYYFCLIMFSLAVSWITSAVNVFTRDVAQFVNLLLQILFWLTPIIWEITIMPEKVQDIVRLNPIYYLIRGYREAFIYGEWFWHSPGEALYFWSATCVLLVAGVVVFRRLKPHFADVL